MQRCPSRWISYSKPMTIFRLRQGVRAIKRNLEGGFWRVGFYHSMRRMMQRRTLTVVMFHRVLPLGTDDYRHADQEYVVGVDEFEKCLLFFKRYYNVIGLDRLLRAVDGSPLPDHALLITFDDGWMDNIEHAQPLLEKHGMRATIFINVEAVLQRDDRWWQDALVEVVRSRPAVLRELSDSGDFYAAARELLRLPLDQRLGRLTEWLSYHPSRRQMLDLPALDNIDRNVWDVGSHGVTHVPFTHAPDLDAEILEPAERLAAWLGQGIDSFAFPHGRYTREIADRVRAGPYRLVFTSDSRLNRTDRELQPTIGRINIPVWACASNASMGRLLWRSPGA